MYPYKLPFTRTDSFAPKQLDAEIQKELEGLHWQAGKPEDTSTGGNPLHLMHLGRVFSLISRQADIQARRIVRLTFALLALTAALLILTGYLCYDAYKKTKSDQQQHASGSKPQEPKP